jgi:hypothetical protein
LLLPEVVTFNIVDTYFRLPFTTELNKTDYRFLMSEQETNDTSNKDGSIMVLATDNVGCGTKEDDDEGCFSNVNALPAVPKVIDGSSDDQYRPGSILKVSTTSSELHMREKPKSWTKLHRPDMARNRPHHGLLLTEKSSSTHRKRKRVKFEFIQVRGYEQTLGDHPCVSCGPPIGLDWEYQDYGNFDLEAFEAKRGPRRSLNQMMLNYYQRMSILLRQHQSVAVPAHAKT